MFSPARCRPAPYLLCLVVFATAACVDGPLDDGADDSAEVAPGDETGGADEAGSDMGSEESGFPAACDTVAQSVAFSLVGPELPEDSCENFAFEGQVVSAALDGGAGSYEIDACPCGESCPEAKRYTLSVEVPAAELLPSMGACVSVSILRVFEGCEPGLLTLADEAGQDYYFASHMEIVHLESLWSSVLGTNPRECAEGHLYDLQINNEGDLTDIEAGTSKSVWVYPTSHWWVHNLSSWSTAEGSDFDWLIIRD